MTKKRLKPWVKYSLMIMLLITILIILIKLLNNNMEKHIEDVSKECSSQGYGITAKYTKEGDKYYVCKK